MKTHALWLGASAATLIWCGATSAQTTPPDSKTQSTAVGEVVVTAERRATNLQETPIAASVLTAGDLAKKGVITIDQLQFSIPSVAVDNFGQGLEFNIRGIGKAEHNSQTTTGVITYRDGVATFPGYFQEEPYFDIAGIEILRGPQGTFVGQNATGGAVFVTSAGPGHQGRLPRLCRRAVRQLHGRGGAGRDQSTRSATPWRRGSRSMASGGTASTTSPAPGPAIRAISRKAASGWACCGSPPPP